MKVIATYTVLIAVLLLPLFIMAETIVVKTKAPQNKNAVFQYRVPKGYDKNRREMYRVFFGGRNTDGKADASGRMGWGKWCDDNGIFLVAPGADIHAHAAYDSDYNNDIFSSSDSADKKNRGIVGYLATPNGSLQKYDPTLPKDKRISTISDQMPYDPKHPNPLNPKKQE